MKKMFASKILKPRRSIKVLPGVRCLTPAQKASGQRSRPCEKDCKVLVNLAQEFSQETTFHGMNVMLAPGVGKFER